MPLLPSPSPILEGLGSALDTPPLGAHRFLECTRVLPPSHDVRCPEPPGFAPPVSALIVSPTSQRGENGSYGPVAKLSIGMVLSPATDSGMPRTKRDAEATSPVAPPSHGRRDHRRSVRRRSGAGHIVVRWPNRRTGPAPQAELGARGRARPSSTCSGARTRPRKPNWSGNALGGAKPCSHKLRENHFLTRTLQMATTMTSKRRITSTTRTRSRRTGSGPAQ